MSVIRIIRGIFDASLGGLALFFSLKYGLEAWAPLVSALLLAWGLYEIRAELVARSPGSEVATIQAEQAAMKAELDATAPR